MLYLLLAIAIGIGATVYLIKKGKIKDSDGDLIPDVVEDAVEDVKETVQETKKRVKRVKEEVADVIEEVKEVVEQAKDIPSAAKGGQRRGRKPASKRSGGSGRRSETKSSSTKSDATLKVDKNKK